MTDKDLLRRVLPYLNRYIFGLDDTNPEYKSKLKQLIKEIEEHMEEKEEKIQSPIVTRCEPECEDRIKVGVGIWQHQACSRNFKERNKGDYCQFIDSQAAAAEIERLRHELAAQGHLFTEEIISLKQDLKNKKEELAKYKKWHDDNIALIAAHTPSR